MEKIFAQVRLNEENNIQDTPDQSDTTPEPTSNSDLVSESNLNCPDYDASITRVLEPLVPDVNLLWRPKSVSTHDAPSGGQEIRMGNNYHNKYTGERKIIAHYIIPLHTSKDPNEVTFRIAEAPFAPDYRRTLTVSRCPGVYKRMATNEEATHCSFHATNNTHRYYTSDTQNQAPKKLRGRNCLLSRDTQYYLNIHAKTPSSDKLTCQMDESNPDGGRFMYPYCKEAGVMINISSRRITKYEDEASFNPNATTR